MCEAIREGDEMACSCGLRWDMDEPDPHKECYQCEKKVPYLFADSRCKDCTRLTPAEVKGESNVSE